MSPAARAVSLSKTSLRGLPVSGVFRPISLLKFNFNKDNLFARKNTVGD